MTLPLNENSKNDVDLSIVIVSFNVCDCLKKCIQSIYDNSGIVSQEIIVVDNASVDETCEMIRKDFPKVRLIENKENLFVPKANNIGIKMSRGKYVLLLNPDVIVLPGSLKALFDYLNSNPDVAAAGPKLINNDGQYEDCAATKRTFPLFLYKLTFLGMLLKSKSAYIEQESLIAGWKRDSDRDVEVMIDVCLMVRRSVLEKAGLYDEDFKLYFAEDDLCNRIIEEGFRIRFLASITCIHLRHQSLISVNPQEIKKIRRRDAFVYANKYFGFTHAYFLKLLMAFTNLSRSVLTKLMAAK